MTAARSGAVDRRPVILSTYVGLVVLAGIGVVALAATAAWRDGVAPRSYPMLLIFGLSLLAAELRPLGWLRRENDGVITVSMAYAFALMFILPGFLTAVFVALVSALADSIRGVPAQKTAFNASMMAVSMAAGQFVLRIGGAQRLLTDDGHLGSAGLILAIVGACATIFALNALLLSVVMSLVTDDHLPAVIKRDFLATLPTDGLLLPLGPVMVVVGSHDLMLLPFAMLLTAAVYRSALYAADRERDATHDHLTGLTNRRLFEAQVEHALDRVQRTGRPAAVMIMDLDGFKEINDTFGHLAGDHVLVEVGRRLQAVAPEGATVSRLGGDEFAVLLPAVDDVEAAELTAVEIATVFRDAVTSPHAPGAELPVSGSIGIALTGPDMGTIGELIRAADTAMYTAKRNGLGHSVARYSEEGTDRYADLEKAIREDELFLVYEPLLDARTEAVMGFEALVRWDRPGHGIVPPIRFIPFAEAGPLIGALTHWVLEESVRHLAQLQADGHRVGMSVNISARNLSDPGFAADVRTVLDRHGVDAALLTLEITETALMSDTALALHTLDRLVELGVALALDDFGAGHSSLAKLRDLPVTVLKIDRSFLADIHSERGRTLIRTFVELARSLGMATTAEGVQSRRDMAFLAEIGCTSLQGHVICQPLRGAESAAWLAGRASIEPTDGRTVDLAMADDVEVVLP